MSRSFLLLTLAAGMLIPAVAAAAAEDKPAGPQEIASVDEFAAIITSYFPKAQGEVKAVQSGRITITLGKNSGVLPGMVLTLWRDGKEIRHPVSGDVIGREEEDVGVVEIIDADETSSRAAIIKKSREPQPGDRARITPKKISAALIRSGADSAGVMSELAQKLNEYGRLSVMDTDKVEAFLRDKDRSDPAIVRKIGHDLGLDAVIAVDVSQSDGKQIISAKIHYLDAGRPLDAVAAVLSPSSVKEALGEVRPFFAPVKEKVEISPDIPFSPRYFASADFDGDGRDEYVFSDGSRLHVYRLEPAAWREVWMENEKNATGKARHINLDSADINGNGRPEIFTTAFVDGRVVSTVIEYKDGAFLKVAETSCFLRTLSYPGKGVILIGQEYDTASFFSGPVKRYIWSGGAYVAGETIPAPKDTGLYGLACANFGGQDIYYVALDDNDRLLVYSKDALRWKSDEQFTAVDASVAVQASGGNAQAKKAAPDKARTARIRGKVLAGDVNGDGKDEIILPKNTSARLFGEYKDAELYALGWTGAGLEQKWIAKDVPGAVMDFHLSRDKDGFLAVALVKSEGGLFTRRHERVMMYSIK